MLCVPRPGGWSAVAGERHRGLVRRQHPRRTNDGSPVSLARVPRWPSLAIWRGLERLRPKRRRWSQTKRWAALSPRGVTHRRRCCEQDPGFQSHGRACLPRNLRRQTGTRHPQSALGSRQTDRGVGVSSCASTPWRLHVQLQCKGGRSASGTAVRRHRHRHRAGPVVAFVFELPRDGGTRGYAKMFRDWMLAAECQAVLKVLWCPLVLPRLRAGPGVEGPGSGLDLKVGCTFT